MGIGPKETSLLERLGRTTEPGEDTLWVQIDQQTREEARKTARIAYGKKHKKSQKPLAPVEQCNLKQGSERCWTWIGETIPSMNLIKGSYYTSSKIREAGFKLPKLTKKPKKGKND